MTQAIERNASCLCGGVRFQATGEPSEVSACHCGQCRKTSGTMGVSAAFDATDVRFSSDGTLAWYRSSTIAERGFCRVCGSRLFWRADGDPKLWVAMGAFDGSTGLSIDRHIFVADRPDWYAIDDGKPQFPAYDEPPAGWETDR
jgi:hypothetical protein